MMMDDDDDDDDDGLYRFDKNIKHLLDHHRGFPRVSREVDYNK